MNPLVSAVIPTRHRPDLLLRAIRSAQHQTYSELEIIVVVDGPDDETNQLLAHLQGPKLRAISLPESVGGAEARNLGVQAARGEWIALLDDDDEWLPEKIERQVQAAQTMSQNNALITCSYLCRSAGQPDVVRPRRFPREHEPVSEYMFDFLCYFQTSTFFCARDLFLRIPFQKDLKSFQDIDWFLRVNSDPSVEFHVVPEPLSIYYVPEERVTITSKLNWRSRLAWGKANRCLMTPRAYSRFIAGSCVGRAVQDGAGFRGFLELFRECALVGSPSVSDLALLTGTFLVTPAQRRRIRDLVFLALAKPATSWRRKAV